MGTRLFDIVKAFALKMNTEKNDFKEVHLLLGASEKLQPHDFYVKMGCREVVDEGMLKLKQKDTTVMEFPLEMEKKNGGDEEKKEGEDKNVGNEERNNIIGKKRTQSIDGTSQGNQSSRKDRHCLTDDCEGKKQCGAAWSKHWAKHKKGRTAEEGK